MEKGSKSIAIFFKYMSIGFLILCLKVSLVEQVSIELVQTLALTFVFCFTIAIWVGLAGMFAADVYQYLKKNSLKLNLKKCYSNAQ